MRISLNLISLAEFAACRRKKFNFIFCQGVYLTENTLQPASVKFVCKLSTNYARSRLQLFVVKSERLYNSIRAGSKFYASRPIN